MPVMLSLIVNLRLMALRAQSIVVSQHLASMWVVAITAGVFKDWANVFVVVRRRSGRRDRERTNDNG